MSLVADLSEAVLSIMLVAVCCGHSAGGESALVQPWCGVVTAGRIGSLRGTTSLALRQFSSPVYSAFVMW